MRGWRGLVSKRVSNLVLYAQSTSRLYEGMEGVGEFNDGGGGWGLGRYLDIIP